MLARAYVYADGPSDAGAGNLPGKSSCTMLDRWFHCTVGNGRTATLDAPRGRLVGHHDGTVYLPPAAMPQYLFASICGAFCLLQTGNVALAVFSYLYAR